MQVLTRSFNAARTGANTQESILTPAKVGENLLRKLFSLHFVESGSGNDPSLEGRLEAQPLYFGGLDIGGRKRNVVYVCTMANNVWAFDADDGKPIWAKPVNLGHPIRPNGTEIDIFRINNMWGILSTPVIDAATQTMYVVSWSSPSGKVLDGVHRLHAVRITDGHETKPPLVIEASAPAQAGQGEAPAKFFSHSQKQRASLLLTDVKGQAGASHKTLFMACGMTHEHRQQNDPPAHGWVIAFDIASFRMTAAWCTTPHGIGAGIWQAGAGPAADENGDVYVMTGNYGVEHNGGAAQVAPGDLAESFVKLHYTAPANAGAAGRLEAVAWFTPFRDVDRNKNGDDDFQDYDLGSGGPIVIPGTGLVLGAGKDGVLYVLDRDTTHFGKGDNYGVLKQRPPIFFTYFPGFVDAEQVQNLDHLYDGKTHHLHGNPVFWRNAQRGGMLFVWGENECLRAWALDPNGNVNFLAKGAEVASAGAGGKGGMPGGMLAASANADKPDSGIVWALAPISGDANAHPVEGILRAYDANRFDPVRNADGTERLKLLWDSKHIPGNTFTHCKFCPPIIADGKVFVPTYDGRVDVYGFVKRTHDHALPTNASSIIDD